LKGEELGYGLKELRINRVGSRRGENESLRETRRGCGAEEEEAISWTWETS
jgi:hypothetical protein